MPLSCHLSSCSGHVCTPSSLSAMRLARKACVALCTPCWAWICHFGVTETQVGEGVHAPDESAAAWFACGGEWDTCLPVVISRCIVVPWKVLNERPFVQDHACAAAARTLELPVVVSSVGRRAAWSEPPRRPPPSWTRSAAKLQFKLGLHPSRSGHWYASLSGARLLWTRIMECRDRAGVGSVSTSARAQR